MVKLRAKSRPDQRSGERSSNEIPLGNLLEEAAAADFYLRFHSLDDEGNESPLRERAQLIIANNAALKCQGLVRVLSGLSPDLIGRLIDPLGDFLDAVSSLEAEVSICVSRAAAAARASTKERRAIVRSGYTKRG